MPKDPEKPEPPRWAKIAKPLMREQGVTQEDLVSVLDVETRGAVGHYFTGRREPSIDQLAALAKRLGVTVSELIGEVPLVSDPQDKREILRLLEGVDSDQEETLLRILRAAAGVDSETS